LGTFDLPGIGWSIDRDTRDDIPSTISWQGLTILYFIASASVVILRIRSWRFRFRMRRRPQGNSSAERNSEGFVVVYHPFAGIETLLNRLLKGFMTLWYPRRGVAC
jgi:hypothetical protein